MSTTYESTWASQTLPQSIIDFLTTLRKGPQTHKCEWNKSVTLPVKLPKLYQNASIEIENSTRSIFTRVKRGRKQRRRQKKAFSRLKKKAKAHLNGNTSPKKSNDSTKSVTYDDMVRERIGVASKIDPYYIPKTLSGNTSIYEASQGVTTSNCSRCTLGFPTSEISKVEEENLQTCVKQIKYVSKTMKTFPKWSRLNLGFRAIITNSFKACFKRLEEEIQLFQSDYEEIKQSMGYKCRKIEQQKQASQQFLKYAIYFSNKFSQVLERMETLAKNKELNSEVAVYSRFEQKVSRAFEKCQILEHLFARLEVKMQKAETNVQLLDEFNILVSNHILHAKTLRHEFNHIKHEYDYCPYLMDNYVWQLWWHFDAVAKELAESTTVHTLEEFQYSLCQSKKENHRAHQFLAAIDSRKKELADAMRKIEEFFTRMN